MYQIFFFCSKIVDEYQKNVWGWHKKIGLVRSVETNFFNAFVGTFLVPYYYGIHVYIMV